MGWQRGYDAVGCLRKKDPTLAITTKAFADSLRHLETHVGLVSSQLGTADPALAETFRTAAIKSFEYTYALALGLIERALEDRTGRPETVAAAGFRNFMRMAWEHELITDAEAWDAFRAMRNITAHTYNDEQAAKVFAVLPQFIVAARHLLTRLEAAFHVH